MSPVRTRNSLLVVLGTLMLNAGNCSKPTGETAPVASAGKSAMKGKDMKTQKATFAAGCFWGVEALFMEIPGVVATTVGYTGGTTQSPTYSQVCTDRTGHAEAVQVEYDPERVSYDQLLDVFWSNHDPTTLNRQGPDSGTQYRSAIFFYDAQQEAVARASKERLERSGRFKRPIVTQIVPATTFYPAEEYHQKYLAKRGRRSCHLPTSG